MRIPMHRAVFVLVAMLIAGCDRQAYCDRELAIAFGDTFLSVRLDQALADDAQATVRALVERCRFVSEEFLVYTSLEDDSELTASLLLLAAQLNDPALLDQLVSEGHSADGLPNTFNFTTLHVAVTMGLRDTFAWALAQGVDPNHGDLQGLTPVMLAARTSQDFLGRINPLIRAGAQIDAVDNFGRSALAHAVIVERTENAELLVGLGADLGLARQGVTDELARAADRPEAVKESLQNSLNSFDETYGPGQVD